MVGARVALACAGVLLAAACLNSTEPVGLCQVSITYTLGDSATGSLSSGDCKQELDGTLVDYYSFDVPAPTQLRIALSSPRNKAFLLLYDQRNAIIVNSALLGAVDTSALVRAMLGTGAYVLGVNSEAKGATGQYRMVAAPDSSRAAGCGVIWVTPGITTTQQIANGDCTQGPGGAGYLYHVYTIVLLRLQEITITEHSTAFLPRMSLVGPTGTTSSGTDSTGTNALINTVVSTQGAYQLWVGSSTQSAVGQYTLTIQ